MKTMPHKAQEDFVLLRPIHFPDGTVATELPRYPDMDKLFVDFMRRKIDEVLAQRRGETPCETQE